MAQEVQAHVPVTFQQLNSPYVRQAVGLMLAVATAAALLVGTWLWSQTPDYRVLFANVSDRDGGEIVAALSQMNVPYQVADGGGAILVPADQVHDARLRLATTGLPRGGAVGFELMENTRLGTSQFLEQMNYQRALEGELARSIQSIAAVRSARVHLAIPKPSVFLRENQKPSASVLVDLYPGRFVESGQVIAIAHLVSSSIANLPLENVTVVDQNGKLMSSNDADADNALDPRQLKYVKTIEHGLADRIEAILEPVVGRENVRAQVTADVDFSQAEAAEELYRPNQQGEAAIRRSQSQETTESDSASGGVPGAFSNQAPAPAEAPIVDPQSAQGGQAAGTNPINTRKDSDIVYEVDKTIRHTRQPVGTVKRLSVAVVVNHMRTVDDKGVATSAPRTAEEMQQIRDLVRQSMGFSEARGDAVTVANAAFKVDVAAETEILPLWRQPANIALATGAGKQLLIAFVALFVFFKILRPMFQRALAPVEIDVQRALGGPGDTGQWAPGDTNGQGSTQGGNNGASNPALIPADSYELSIESAKQLARDQPKLVASVVKGWVSDGG